MAGSFLELPISSDALLAEAIARDWDGGCLSEVEVEVDELPQVPKPPDASSWKQPILGHPAPSPSESEHPLSRKSKRKRQKKVCDRRRRRNREQQEDAALESPLTDLTDTDDDAAPTDAFFKARTRARPPKKVAARRAEEGLPPISVPYSLREDAPVVSTGWQGRVVPAVGGSKAADALERQGFRVIPPGAWDFVNPAPILDNEGRRIAVLVGRPKDPGWDAVTSASAKATEKASAGCKFSMGETVHRRGCFSALSYGIYYAMGRTAPGNRKNSPANAAALEKLREDPDIQRLAGFQSSAFQLFAPRLWNLYLTVLCSLLAWAPSLVRVFSCSVFAAFTVNFGPGTVCVPHVDEANLAWGWCAITALGSYDWRKGGHLVLWDLQLIIPFPPGTTILLPSALLRHANTPIQAGETRYSFTQYSPAGLFRWVSNGFRPDSWYNQQPKSTVYKEWVAKRAKRWDKGLTLFEKGPL